MDHTFITAPSQMKLINDLLFDVTGLPVSLNEMVLLGIAAMAVNMIFKSPLFGRT